MGLVCLKPGWIDLLLIPCTQELEYVYYIIIINTS
jgi:hypothetical protein